MPSHLSNFEPDIATSIPSIDITGGLCHIEKKGSRMGDGGIDTEGSLDTNVSRFLHNLPRLTVLPAATVRVPVVLAAAPKLQRISVDWTFVTGPLEY
jgi:hypothetical protein